MAFFNKVTYFCQVQCLNISCKRLYRKVTIANKRSLLDEISNIWKEKLPSVLFEPNNVSKETWESMRNTVIELNKNNHMVVDSSILQVFYDQRCVDAGINYYKFLEDNKYNISIVILSQYLSLYHLKETLTDVEKIHISNVCKKIIDQCKLVPAFAVEAIITSLCQIDEWEKAIMVLKEFESHDTARVGMAYISLINCLMKHDKSTLVHEYLKLGMQKGTLFPDSVYSTYLTYCQKEKNTFNKKIEDLFLLWRKYGIIPLKNTIEEYIKVCEEVGWSAKKTTVSKHHRCNVCNETLEEIKLSKQEFDHLFELIKKNVITNNAYRTSDPKELDDFKKFIETRKPYDFIIDGLNAMSAIIRHKGQFGSILTRLNKDNKKVLVIGRYHMKNTIKKLNLMKSADFYYVNNLSNDDAFILYATFESGNGTNIISRDLMRQHKSTFHSIEFEILFKRWQIMHQYIYNARLDKVLELHKETHIASYALKKNNSWHIPYSCAKKFMKPDSNDIGWACFSMCS